eukprot:1957944-Pyramimonas_sp.AAC.1
MALESGGARGARERGLDIRPQLATGKGMHTYHLRGARADARTASAGEPLWRSQNDDAKKAD